MNAYRIVGLVSFIVLLIFSLYGSILYGSPYPLVSFLFLTLVGVLLARILFKKEKQPRKKRKTEEKFEWNMYMNLMLIILVLYPLLSIPRYSAGTPIKALLAGYAILIMAEGIFGILVRIYIWNKMPNLRFTPISELVPFVIIGAGILVFAISSMLN